MGNATSSLIYVLLFFVGAYLIVVLVAECVKRVRMSAARHRERRKDRHATVQTQHQDNDQVSAPKAADKSKQGGSL